MEQEAIPSSSQHAHFSRFRETRDNHHSRSTESALSEHDSIYNALKAGSSGTEDNSGRHYSSSHHHYAFPSTDLGGNIAMLLSTSPKPTVVERPTGLKRTRSRWRRSQTLPDDWFPSKTKTTDPLTELIRDAKSKANTIRWPGRRRAASLGDADNRLRTPKWAANLFSPVKPFFPRYPPPVRSPTPPGVPSFGTPEAINYASQFSVRSYAPSTPPGRLSSRRATESYAHTLRRLFGITAPTDTQTRTNRRQTALARAEDGTAVQGRFPYRSSGHGVYLHRQLEDHQFHQAFAPVTELDNANMDDRFDAGTQPLRREHHHHDIAKNRYSMPTAPQAMHSYRATRSHFAHPPSLSPAGLSSRKPLPPIPSLASPGNSSYYSCMSQPQTGVTMPVFDDDLSNIGGTNGPRGNIPLRIPSLLQQPLPQAPAQRGSILTASSIHETQEASSFWSSYKLLSQYVCQYFPCCSLVLADADDEDNNDDGVTVGHNSRTSRLSRASGTSRVSRNSGESFMTARSWSDDHQQPQRQRYSVGDPFPGPPPNTLSSWTPAFRERCPRPIRSPLVADPMLA